MSIISESRIRAATLESGVGIDALNVGLSAATIFVVLGVLLEGAEHWEDIRKKGWKPRIPKIGFLILLIGLAGAWKFQSLIAQADTDVRVEAIKEMAALNREAANARLETAKIEKEYGPRRLTHVQLLLLASKLEKFRGEIAVFSVRENDTDSANFAAQIASSLVGWNTQEAVFNGGSRIQLGITITSTSDGQSKKAARFLADELTSDGFPVPTPTAAPDKGVGTIWVFVFPRPLPMLRPQP